MERERMQLDKKVGMLGVCSWTQVNGGIVNNTENTVVQFLILIFWHSSNLW